jgi:uncharacterized membrane protein YeaQ/YmgE (transglycosylase-associated protein family)
MLQQDFVAFLILAVIAVVVSGVLHYVCKYYVTDDVWSFLSKCVVGWFGAWLGSPVLGHWFAGLNYGSVYYVPAVIGALGAVIVAVDMARMFAGRGGGS